MRIVAGMIAGLMLNVAPALAQQPINPAPPAHRTAADFAQLPYMSDPELSPDGTHIAAKVAIDGKQSLVIRDLFDAKSAALVSAGDNEFRSWRWVNDGWLAIEIGAIDNFEGDPIYLSRVAGISADGRTIKPIAFRSGGQGARVIWSARDGTPRVLMSMQKSIFIGDDFWPTVSEVDVSTGRTKPVVAGQTGVMNWFADPSGAVRMGIGYNDADRTSRLLYRSGSSGSFRPIDRASAKAKDSLTVPFLSTDATAPAVTVSAPDDVAALYELDLARLAVGKKLFGIDGYDIDGVQMSPDGNKVAGVFYTTDHARVKWMDADLAAIQESLDKAVAPRTARIVSLSRSQKQMIVHVGSASEPGSYYYYDAAQGGAMTRFAFVNTAIKAARLGPVSTFRYKARDGLSIEAVLTLPKDRAAKNLPLILMPHGGPEARDSAEYDWWVQFLADRGYAVVQPNYRGSTGYGSKFEDAGDGQWGLKMQDDLNDAVDHLVGQGTVDAKRVCIIGASYGGYAALRGAERDGARYRCAISYAGVSDLNGMIRYDGQFLNSNASRAGWKSSAPDLKAVSPINDAASFGTPILIMHGKKDLRVPVAQSRRMAERLKAAGKPYQYIEQPEGDHHFSREADRLQFLEAMEAFLTKYNPAG